MDERDLIHRVFEPALAIAEGLRSVDVNDTAELERRFLTRDTGRSLADCWRVIGGELRRLKGAELPASQKQAIGTLRRLRAATERECIGLVDVAAFLAAHVGELGQAARQGWKPRSHATVAVCEEAGESTERPASNSSEPDGSKPADRNDYFLTLHKDGLGPAAIRDKWNGMTQSEREAIAGAGRFSKAMATKDKGASTVSKAIRTATTHQKTSSR